MLLSRSLSAIVRNGCVFLRTSETLVINLTSNQLENVVDDEVQGLIPWWRRSWAAAQIPNIFLLMG